MFSAEDITGQIYYLNSLEQQEQEAFINHNDMEALAIYNNIAKLKKSILTSLICSCSSGTVAAFIRNTKYAEIDKAVEKTLHFLSSASDEELHNLKVDNASIAELIYNCYMEGSKMNNTIKNKKLVRIVYYDETGKHKTKPCNHLQLIRINCSIPSTDLPTVVYSMWFGDEETGHKEEITVPFTNTIEAV